MEHTHKPSTPSFFHKNLKWLALILVVAVGIFFFVKHDSKEEEAKKKPATPAEVPIETAQVQKGNVPVYVDALGTVTPISQVSIVSRVQGQIMKVNYQEGQMVKKGDSLIEIDPAPYQAAVDQAQGQMIRDESLLKEAKINLTRYKEAYKFHAVSKQQFQDQEQVVAQDEGVVKSDLGVLENAKINLSYCHIQAPIDGRVGLRLIDAGNMVQTNSTTPLVVITQIAPITVVFNVAEDHLSEIQAKLMENAQNMKAEAQNKTGKDQIAVQTALTMEVDAFDRTHEKKIAEGKFLTLDNSIDPTTGTIKVKAIFDNKDGALFPNQFVNARLLVDTVRNANLLTTAAIQRNAQGPFVYLIGQDNKAKIQPVKVGVAVGDETSVEGIDAGAVVASAGFDKLAEGAKVKPQNAQREKQ